METLDPQAKAELAELMAKSMNDPEMTEHLKRLVMTLPIKGTDKGTDLMKNLPVTGELPAKAVIANGKQLPNVLFSGDLSQAVLGQIRLLSLIGLVLVILFGSMGTYWVTGMALRPVQQLSARIQSIDSTSLAARLPDEGIEDEVKKLITAFNGMLERLERSFDQQRAFAVDSAHELRTPLTILRTSLEVVNDDPNATVEDYRATARMQERALERLEGLVGDLLVLAQSECLPVVEEVALGPLLEEVRADLSPLAAEYDVSVELTGDLHTRAQGDFRLLARAFGNLVENAIRYNHRGGRVTIDVTEAGSTICVKVIDQGIGISAADLPHIFERFYRVDRSRGRHTGGAGLGLAIVQHVVRQHRGDIQVTSSAGKGSTFTVTLPGAA